VVAPSPALDVRSRDGVRLAFRDEGSGGPPVLLVHGMACRHTHMTPQLEHLRARHRTVAVDLRGHGESSAPAGEYGIDVFVDDLLFLVEELGLERPVLVGHSLGGSISLATAVAAPDRVGGLVMLDSGIRPRAASSAELSGFYDTLGGDDHAERVRRFTRERLFDPVDPPDVIEWVADDMGSVRPDVFLAMGAGVLSFDSRAAALASTVPSLIILADRPFADPDTLQQLGPNWRVARTVGAGHFHQLVVPAQVNAMLDRFLELLGR
jgi:pimeloyl-ACP methyl ester carboxylesterase